MSGFGFNFNNSYLQLPGEFYTFADPLPVCSPEAVIINNELATSLGIPLDSFGDKEKAVIFSGNRQLSGSSAFCQAYAGHQYAHFTILGDGRAHILGEHIAPDGARVDVQLKGSGRTPYSRSGDGRAALGPMLREYIVSEAMFSLGIPTTRSLAVVRSGEEVIREEVLPGAILTRIARSHIRVGTFEFAASQNGSSYSKALLEYTVKRHFSAISKNSNIALAFLKKIMQIQADLITQWMRVGFIHGVMNTDNMSICGETIDYGPCAFMDEYDPDTVYSYIDQHGRYAFGNQPNIAQWNIARLAESLLPLIHDNETQAIDMAAQIVNQFSSLYDNNYLVMMRSKLGLLTDDKGDQALISDLLNWMQENAADYTNTFTYLTYGKSHNNQFYEQESFQAWIHRWKKRLTTKSDALMKKNNPVVIPRNHQVEKALLSAAQGNLKPLHQLLEALKYPYQYDTSFIDYQLLPKPDERIQHTFCGT